MSNTIIKGINQTLQGFYKVAIVDSHTGEVTWQQYEWQKNLILNQGMDNLYNNSVADQMLYGVAGTGTRPNSFDGGTSTITQSGAGVYLYNRGGYITDFTSSVDVYSAYAQVGDSLAYGNGSQSMITAVNAGGFMLTVTPNYTIASGNAQTFTIWKTSQSGLETEVKRSNTYVVGSSNCGTTVVGNVSTHQRTYDFTTEVGLVGYNEVGIAWDSIGANTVFSRILLPSTINISSGNKLRIIYNLQATWGPSTLQYKTASVGGWPVSPSTTMTGTESLQSLLTSTIVVGTGASDNNTAILDPYFVNNGAIYLSLWSSTISSSLAAFGSAVDRSAGSPAAGYTTSTMTKASYVNGSFSCTKTGTLLIGDMNTTNIRTVGLGRYQLSTYNPASAASQVICFLYDQNQTKNSSQTLSFTYGWSWSRILE